MTGKEKLYFLLMAIEDARDITPSGHPLLIDPTNTLNRKYSDTELSQLLIKLEKDEKVLMMLKVPITTQLSRDEFKPYESSIDGCWYIKLLPSFDGYFDKIQHEPEYFEFTGKKPAKALKEEIAEQALRPTGFTPKSVLPVITSAEEVIKNFSPQNYQFVLKVIRGILSLIDFSPDGKVAYQLQSPHGQQLINERRLLDRLSQMGLLSHYGEDGIFGIVTLGNINIEILKKVESGLTTLVRPTINPIPPIAMPEQSDNAIYEPVKQPKSKPTETMLLPKEWSFNLTIKQPVIEKSGVPVFTFRTDWSNKVRYFDCLWNNFGQRVSYQNLYEYKRTQKYPTEKGVIWRTNKRIRDEINDLRSDPGFEKLPFCIETSKGCILTFDPKKNCR